MSDSKVFCFPDGAGTASTSVDPNHFLKSSIPDEQHLALYIKDVIDDVDAYDGIVFNRWYADTRRKGIAIDWEDML